MTTEAVRAMPETTMIAVEHVRKSFGPVPVLKDISLSVPKGGVLSLIGRAARASRPCCAA